MSMGPPTTPVRRPAPFIPANCRAINLRPHQTAHITCTTHSTTPQQVIILCRNLPWAAFTSVQGESDNICRMEIHKGTDTLSISAGEGGGQIVFFFFYVRGCTVGMANVGPHEPVESVTPARIEVLKELGMQHIYITAMLEGRREGAWITVSMVDVP